jgi:UPF0271 protein
MQTTRERAAVVDLNADIGEGFGIWKLGNDDALLDIVTSASVACGFHGGDPSIMRRICSLAVERGVTIGAHVGYRDLAGFGRRTIDMPPEALTDEIIYQIAALDGFARMAGSQVRYVKPHGALNNVTVTDAVQAAAIVDAVARYPSNLALLVQPHSELERQARLAALPTVLEAFADRAYAADGTLVPRGERGAVIDDSALIARRAVRMIRDHAVSTVDGGDITVAARSLCVHGDTPGAVEIAHMVRQSLLRSGCQLHAFTQA